MPVKSHATDGMFKLLQTLNNVGKGRWHTPCRHYSGTTTAQRRQAAISLNYLYLLPARENTTSEHEKTEANHNCKHMHGIRWRTESKLGWDGKVTRVHEERGRENK